MKSLKTGYDKFNLEKTMKNCEEENQGELRTIPELSYIFLYCPITREIASTVCDELTGYLQSSNDITIEINSSGGNFEDAIAIISKIEECKKTHKVITKIASEAQSGAAMIALSGSHIKMSKFGFIMLHDVLYGFIDVNQKEFQKITAQTEKQYEVIMKHLLQKTKLNFNSYKKQTKNSDWFLDAKEALKLGLVHEIY